MDIAITVQALQMGISYCVVMWGDWFILQGTNYTAAQWFTVVQVAYNTLILCAV